MIQKSLNLADFDAVAFDVEGTLADTIPTHHDSRTKAFQKHGYGHITPEQHALGPIYGATPSEIIGGILHTAGEIEKDGPFSEHPVVQSIIGTKQRYFGELAAKGFDEMPQATAFFKDVAQHFPGKTALVTASELHFIQPFLDRYTLNEFLTPGLVITHETLQAFGLQAKPAADSYNLAKQRLDSTKLLVFEDTVVGVTAAKAAGATVVALGFEPNSAKRFQQGDLKYMPDFFVKDYAKARQLFGDSLAASQ